MFLDLFHREVESRQAVELAYKTLESEFKKRENLVNQYENEVNDLRFAFYHEREARINQVTINMFCVLLRHFLNLWHWKTSFVKLS